MTEVEIIVSGGKDGCVSIEVSAGSSYERGPGTEKEKIGVIGSIVQYLTVVRRLPCDIKLKFTGPVIAELDGKEKRAKSSLSISSKTKRVVVREKP